MSNNIRKYQTQAAIELAEFVRSLGNTKIVIEDELTYSEVSDGLFVEYRFADNVNGGVKHLRFGAMSLEFYEFSRMKWFVENHKLVFGISEEILSIFKERFSTTPVKETISPKIAKKTLSSIEFGHNFGCKLTTTYDEYDPSISFKFDSDTGKYTTKDPVHLKTLIAKSLLNSAKMHEYRMATILSYIKNEEKTEFIWSDYSSYNLPEDLFPNKQGEDKSV
jgi:hypothetical protein